MAADAKRSRPLFEASAFESFRFLTRELDARGRVTLRYALDDAIFFVEEFDLPVEDVSRKVDDAQLDGLLSLLHWVAGVSYFKTALPPRVSCETGAPPPATAALLEALYSEGLAELAYTNGLAGLPRPRFPRGPVPAPARGGGGDRRELERDPDELVGAGQSLGRVLVPIGGGKDSAVALEIV